MKDVVFLMADKMTVRAFVIVALTSTIIYLTVQEMPVAEVLVNGFFTGLGYYFGKNAQQEISNAVRRMRREG